MEEPTFISLVGQLMQVFMFSGFLALLVERIVELLIQPIMPEAAQKYIAHTAVGIGALIALAFGVDLLTPLAVGLGLAVPYPLAGSVITGLVIGGGSNLLHDLWPGSTAKRENVIVVGTVGNDGTSEPASNTG